MLKSKIIAVLMFFTTLAAFAQPSTITVFSEDGDKFWVILDGAKQNPQPSHKVVIPNQTAQFLKMKVIFENEKIPNLTQSVQFTDVDNVWNDVTYSIKKTKQGKYVIRVSSWQPSKGGATATSQPTPLNNTPKPTPVQNNPVPTPVQNTPKPVSTSTNTTTQTTTVGTPVGNIGTNENIQDDENGNVNMNINMNVPGMNMNTNTTTVQSTYSTTTNTNPAVGQPTPKPTPTPAASNPTPSKPAGCSFPMSDVDFADAKKSISSKGFEDTKLQTAKQVVKNNCLNTNQVKEVCKLFGFEETKLDFAKLAYDKTTDKNNFYKVGDIFGFSSSVDELNQFLESK